tara:strand:- start:9228 stop:9677 length:450 start_codon:yes stop_codon:yes gene_type:complete
MATLTIELPEQVTQGQMMQALESLGCELRLARDGRNYTAVPRVRSVRLNITTLQSQAEIFRKQYDKTHSGGYVIFFRGQAVAWKQQLDHPSGWEPGCIALDKHGKQWVAAGGNGYEGAMRWEAVDKQPSNVTRMPPRIRDVSPPGPGAA